MTREGRLPNGDGVGLYERDNGCAIFVDQQPAWLLLHNDRAVLENYFTVTESAIEWADEGKVRPVVPPSSRR